MLTHVRLCAAAYRCAQSDSDEDKNNYNADDNLGRHGTPVGVSAPEGVAAARGPCPQSLTPVLVTLCCCRHAQKHIGDRVASRGEDPAGEGYIARAYWTVNDGKHEYLARHRLGADVPADSARRAVLDRVDQVIAASAPQRIRVQGRASSYPDPVLRIGLDSAVSWETRLHRLKLHDDAEIERKEHQAELAKRVASAVKRRGVKRAYGSSSKKKHGGKRSSHIGPGLPSPPPSASASVRRRTARK